MEYRELYQNKIQEIQDLKSQIHILETILRNFLPVVEKKKGDLNGRSISKSDRRN